MFLLTAFFYSCIASARPEYAAKLAVNRCTMCHVSPIGGGPRNTTGKAFGARGFALGPYSSQDLISVDARALYYVPEKTTPESRGGLAWMAGIVGGNIPLTSPEDPQELRLVFNHNLGGFQPGGRDFYLRWQRHGDENTSRLPQHLLLGRFQAPFGIVNDEHRIYTRIQTQTTWNHFEMGALASGNLNTNLHYDLALVNGENTAGAAINSGQAHTWGGIANFRYAPAIKPFVLGLSASHHNRVAGKSSASARAFYGILSLDRLKSSPFPGSFIFEYTQADKMNPNLETGFIDTTTTYDETIADSRSEGILAQLNYDFSARTTFILRYDQLTVDKDFPADAFRRYGVGIRKYLHANTILSARYEISEANHPTQKDSNAKGAIDAFFMVLQIGI